MRKKVIRYSLIATAVVTAGVLLAVFLPSGLSITGEGKLSISSHVVLAANRGVMANGEPVPQQIEVALKRGGPPVVSINFDDPASLEEDALTIIFSYGLPSVHISKRDFVEQKPGEREAEREAEAEGRCKEEVTQSLEIWTLLSDIYDLYPNDPVCQDPPQLLDNERVEKVKGKDYLVIAIAYFDVHIFSFDPLRFTVKMNGLEAGPITGEWWR